MQGRVEIDGSSVVMLFGNGRQPRTPPMRPRHFGPANDNGPREPGMTVTLRKTLEKSGVAIKIKIPVEEFVGVAVSTSISEDGVLSSAIELVHPDPELNYQVFEEAGNANVVAEWQNWGKKLRLPLYIKSGDGALIPYSQTVDGVALGSSSGRRRIAISRRPRFLTRRKPGESTAV